MIAYRPEELAVVARSYHANRPTLAFVRHLRHPPELVWAALTDPAHLREWAPFDADRDLSHPGDATLTMVDGDVRLDLPGRVIRAVPPTLLEYTWGDDLLRWELGTIGSGTWLTLVHTVDDYDFVPKVAAGWHICLDVAERHLDGEPVGRIVGQAALDHGWESLREAYAKQLDRED